MDDTERVEQRACQECRGPLPPPVRKDGRRLGRPVRFCSKRCSGAAYYRAHAVVTSSGTACVVCATPIAPRVRRDGRREGRQVRYCSPRCNNAAHYRAHVDDVLQRTRAYYAANREWYQAYAKAWFPKNRDKQRAAARKWRAANLDFVRARDKQWARQRRAIERQLRPLVDALVAACCTVPLDHLVAFTDEHLTELRRVLRANLERQLGVPESVH